MPSQTVIHGDCLDIMPDLDAVDCVVTDPPYGLNFQSAHWDARIPDWLDEAMRVAPIIAFPTEVMSLWRYPEPDWVCCWYREASNSHSRLGGFCHWSPVLIYGEPRFPVDSIKLHAIQHAYPKGFGHPCPKPVALMEWLLRNCCPPGGTVLDPFLGSGTTLVAAKKLGMNGIGIEREEAYCRMAEERLAKTPEPEPVLLEA